MNRFVLRDRLVSEIQEGQILAPGATLASDSVGRVVPEEPDPWRTCFERDRDRILHSKAFRRLKHKTQVFMNPEGDHYVTRLTHTLQVTQVGAAIARGLSLNPALSEAICLGHDVGHSPFGHTGEDALSEFVDGEWRHSDQSVRIFEVLEPLNLTAEVLDGIRAHPWKVEAPARTPEGGIVRFADRIAYLAHDALDALRAGVLGPADARHDVARRPKRLQGALQEERAVREACAVLRTTEPPPLPAGEHGAEGAPHCSSPDSRTRSGPV